MNGLDDSGQDKVLECHEPADRQKCVDGGRSRNKGMVRSLEVLDKLTEMVSDDEREKKKADLN